MPGPTPFSRTTLGTHIVDGVAQKTSGHRRPRADGLVFLPGHHDGHLAWDTYERMQQLLADNTRMTGHRTIGAVPLRLERDRRAAPLRAMRPPPVSAVGRTLFANLFGDGTAGSGDRRHHGALADRPL
jgi:hypothetical protein